MNEKINNLDFTQDLAQAFEACAVTYGFKIGHLITSEGETENKLILILDGAVKVYYLSELGEKILRLGYSGSILNSLSSFLNR